ncbi:hypothetical protein M6B38_161070 [Iris pallida]|uniref:Uncharacterized protein n=1 Tax=Iris pallida TaxID=29817 RepID=A0AAX6EYN1_IRIPA|nr:hypothetical protein M6B38_161070 [Iris pallida]
MFVSTIGVMFHCHLWQRRDEHMSNSGVWTRIVANEPGCRVQEGFHVLYF